MAINTTYAGWTPTQSIMPLAQSTRAYQPSLAYNPSVTGFSTSSADFLPLQDSLTQMLGLILSLIQAYISQRGSSNPNHQTGTKSSPSITQASSGKQASPSATVSTTASNTNGAAIQDSGSNVLGASQVPNTPSSAGWAGNSFHYQCQNVSDDVDALSKSNVDTMFLETRYLKDGQLQQLQTKPDGSKRNILAYQSMSETGSWTGNEWTDANAAGIVRGSNPSWPDCKYVDVTSPEWQKLMVQRATDVAKSGADGIFLDTMDGWSKIGGDPEKNKAAMKKIVEAMATAARAINPNFKIVANNDSDLAAGDSAYNAAVDGHMREDGNVNTNDQTEKSQGKAIFVENYTGNSKNNADAAGYLYEEQVDKSLSHLPAI